VVAAILCSFTYVVAQIYGVGLITSHLTGVAFEIGIFLGLGGILVCSFLGGMRAVTWTQVAQYIILVIAYLVPVVWLSVKQTGVPVPQRSTAAAREGDAARKQLCADPKELEVIALFKARADEYAAKLKDVPPRWPPSGARRAGSGRAEGGNAPLARDPGRREARWLALPATTTPPATHLDAGAGRNEARAQPLGGMPPHGRSSSPATPTARRPSAGLRRFAPQLLALVFCLMVGTAALPHILMRCYTTPSVREARQSVTWSLFFILLLYLTAPALAVLVKYEVFNVLVGTPFDQLPAWMQLVQGRPDRCCR
jgi:cation/acetate symporter